MGYKKFDNIGLALCVCGGGLYSIERNVFVVAYYWLKIDLFKN
jgi:hypothetical protein